MLLLSLHVISLVAIVLSALCFRFELLAFKPAFLIFVFALLVAAVTGLMKLVAVFSNDTNASIFDYGSILLGIIVSLVILIFVYKGVTSPRIHDVYTRVSPPIEFECVTAQRLATDNNLSINENNKDAYQISSLSVSKPASEVAAIVIDLMKERNWQLCPIESSANDAVYPVEATAVTTFFGFKDDVRVEVQRVGNRETVIDMRSASRVGESDFGVNAKRVRDFLEDLDRKLGE